MKPPAPPSLVLSCSLRIGRLSLRTHGGPSYKLTRGFDAVPGAARDLRSVSTHKLRAGSPRARWWVRWLLVALLTHDRATPPRQGYSHTTLGPPLASSQLQPEPST